MTDIVERLRQTRKDVMSVQSRATDALCHEAADEIERLRAEVEEWKDRYEAERNDHEATMKHADEEHPVR